MDDIEPLACRFHNSVQLPLFLPTQLAQGIFLWMSHDFAPFSLPLLYHLHVSNTSQRFYWQREIQLRDGPLAYSLLGGRSILSQLKYTPSLIH